jgi:hypothetical protein
MVTPFNVTVLVCVIGLIAVIWSALTRPTPQAPTYDLGQCTVTVSYDAEDYPVRFFGRAYWHPSIGTYHKYTALELAHAFIDSTEPIKIGEKPDDWFLPRRRVHSYTITNEAPYVIQAKQL